jgi:hypothetical protein
MSSERSYLNAVLRDPDTMSVMVAPGPPGPLTTDKHDGTVHDVPIALVSTNSTAHNPEQFTEPNTKWDGNRSKLAPFLEELNVSLLAEDSALHTFAVEYFAMLNNGKTIIVHPGQAAQLDGVLARPAYDWDHPAPEGVANYGVGHIDIVQKYYDLHTARRLANPALPEDPPVVPMGTPYPIDTNLYILSAPMLHQYAKKLNAYVLSRISDSATRYELARRFQDGRALLAHLHEQAVQGLTSSEVKFILDEIDALVASGLVSDTPEHFKEYLVAYDRLHRRIPAANAARDSDPIAAMRAIKVVVHGRASVGQAVQTHLRAGGVDENDKDAVIAALNVYLHDTASMARIVSSTSTVATPVAPDIQALVDQAVSLAVKPDPRKNAWTRRAKPPEPCFHCGGDHWADTCTHRDKGTNKYRVRQLLEKVTALETAATSCAPPKPTEDDKLALVTAKLGALATRPPVQL